MHISNERYSNILIVKLSAIGDCIHALPVAAALKHCFPQARVTWIVEKPAYNILENNPNIDEIIIFDKHKFKTLSGLLTHAPEFAKLLRDRKYDLVLDLQGLFKSAAIAYLSGAPKKLVYCNARELSHLVSERVCGPHDCGHIVERYLDVVRSLGCSPDQAKWDIAITDEEVQQANRIVANAGLDLDSPFVILAPGANWPNKRWNVGNFAVLADKLAGQGIAALLVGAPSDKSLAESIGKSAKLKVYDVTGQTSLKQLAYLLKQAKCFIGGDTGPMHLAAALGASVVALMGPTDAVRNGPYGLGHIVLTTSHSCHGCWKRTCPKNLICLDGINVETVYSAVMQLVL